MPTATSTSLPKVKSTVLKTTRNLPKLIKILNIPIKIIKDNNVMNRITVRDGAEEAWGYTIEEDQAIALAENVDYDIEANTVLHEIGHWVFMLSGGRAFFSHKQEERFISLMTTGYLDTLRNNKELRDYLFPEEED